LDRSCLLDPDTKISIDKCHWLLEASASEARIEDFGLRMSENRRLSNLGPLALATRDAGSLREVLHAVIRYLRLHTDVFVMSFEEIDELAIVKAELVGSRLSSARQMIEMAVGVTYRVMSQLLSRPEETWLVWFSHSAPKDTTTHQRVFGPRVEVGRDFTGIICSDPTMLMCGRPAPCRPMEFQSTIEHYFPLTGDEKALLLQLYPADWHPR
jgi:hypothetical protein